MIRPMVHIPPPLPAAPSRLRSLPGTPGNPERGVPVDGWPSPAVTYFMDRGRNDPTKTVFVYCGPNFERRSDKDCSHAVVTWFPYLKAMCPSVMALHTSKTQATHKANQARERDPRCLSGALRIDVVAIVAAPAGSP